MGAMNDIHGFLAVMSAIFVGVAPLMVVLTYLEQPSSNTSPRQRIFRKKAATGSTAR